MLDIRFLLVGEGPFDNSLNRPLEKLCIHCGAASTVGVAPDLRRIETKSRKLIHQVRAALDLEPATDILFIHRDADSRDPSSRHTEIQNVTSKLDRTKPSVPVVPVQTTEAWALVSESAIRRAADNPSGDVPLDIPEPSEVEKISEPKKRLNRLLLDASGYSGRHLENFKDDLATRKRRIVEQIEVTGPVSQVPAWQKLSDDITSALEDIKHGRY